MKSSKGLSDSSPRRTRSGGRCAFRSRARHCQRKTGNRRAALARKQVVVTAPHGFGGMSHELIDDALVHALRREVAGEAVAVGVEADLEPVFFGIQAPCRPPEGAPEEPVCLVRT